MWIGRLMLIGALSAGVLTVPSAAVEPGKPSVTALLAAANRANGARNPDASMRNPDYLAEKFLGPDERAILEKAAPEVARTLNRDFEAAVQSLERGGFADVSGGGWRARASLMPCSWTP
jgi:hypothetical protein